MEYADKCVVSPQYHLSPPYLQSNNCFASLNNCFASLNTQKLMARVHTGGKEWRGQGNGAIGTPVAVLEEVEYGLVSLNNF